MALVKTSRTGILLKCPELKALRMFLTHFLEQPAASVGIEARWMDVEMMKPTVMDYGEAHDLAIAIGHPGLGFAQDPANEVPRFIVGMEMGQVRHRRSRGEKNLGRIGGIPGCRAPNRSGHAFTS